MLSGQPFACPLTECVRIVVTDVGDRVIRPRSDVRVRTFRLQTNHELKNEFLKKGIQLSIDGLEPTEIRDILETEVDFIRSRHQLGAEIFMTMGSFAPALGMIGTLIGLVQMLQTMDDPASIGPSMAVALLTTF